MYCGLQCGPREPPIQPVSTGIRRGGGAGRGRREPEGPPSPAILPKETVQTDGGS